jgi:hydrophobe/amphiphile efflux-3 (HAE3) family protein
VALTAVLGYGLTTVTFRSSQDTMVSRGSNVYQDNVRYQGAFGGEVMVVIFQGDIRQMFTPANRAQLAQLEGQLQRTGLFQSISGPDTALEFARNQLSIAAPLSVAALARDQQAAATAARLAAAAKGMPSAAQAKAAQQAQDQLARAFTARTAADGNRLGAVGPQNLDNPRFVEFLLFDQSGGVRPAVKGEFPDADHALMMLTLRGNMSIDDEGRAAGDVVHVVGASHFPGFTTMATGSAALLKEVNDRMRSDMARTGALAVLVMAVLLLLVFRARWRLLVLPLVVIGIVWVFGTLGYLGVPLTMVTISGLPILIGLGVDFAVQVHSRYEEELSRCEDGHLARALGGLGPALTASIVAAVVGFLALCISSVPMIQQFGLLLGLGACVLLLSVLIWVPVTLVLGGRWFGTRPLPASRPLRIERVVRSLTAATADRPMVIVLVTLALAGSGLYAQRHLSVESDPEKFVPQNSAVLGNLRHLRDVAGSSASIGFMVEANTVMRPDVLAWMASYENRELSRYPGQLTASNSIASITQQVTGSTPTVQDVATVIGAAPDAIRKLFGPAGSSRAQILFSVGHLSLGQQAALLKAMERDVDAPAGVRVTPSGLTVVGIAAVHAMQQGQSTMTYVALLTVIAWLVLWFRSIRTAFLVMLPVVAAVGASSLVVAGLGLQVSMLAALSTALVIAVCTEFSVLIVTRYEEERRAGRTPDAAIVTAGTRIGRAFVTSGLTTAGGFAVLALSGFPLLSSFGAIVAINVVASMVSALVILPPLLRREGRRGDDGFAETGECEPRVGGSLPADRPLGGLGSLRLEQQILSRARDGRAVHLGGEGVGEGVLGRHRIALQRGEGVFHAHDVGVSGSGPADRHVGVAAGGFGQA